MSGATSRRSFLKGAAYLGAGAAVVPSINVLGANDKVRVGVIGVGIRGRLHVEGFANLPDVDVVAVCDPDLKRMEGFDESIEKIQDLRDLLDRKDIDAVVIAAPNHWHVPATIMACQAGKDVYVEKPATHSIWGGQKMLEAVRKYDRVVQTGTQQRSCPAPNAAGADIRAGEYGEVKWVHCMQYNLRESIGLVTEPQPVPGHIDYNLWAGPAPMTPVMRERFHYDWHWQWNWGDGEFGNWAVHYLDDLCNLLAWDSAPTSVVTAGGRFIWEDNGQTPNMEFALMERKGINVVAEIRDLPYSSERRSKAVYLGRRGGNIIQCENGVVKIARGGGAAYDNDGKQIKKYPGDGGRAHARNFIDAVKSRRKQDLNAPIAGGVLSSLICQQGNISYRMGRQASVDQIRQSMKDHPDALDTIKSVVTQLNANNADMSKLQLGPKLSFDADNERFTGDYAEQANKYLRYDMRSEFAVPEKV